MLVDRLDRIRLIRHSRHTALFGRGRKFVIGGAWGDYISTGDFFRGGTESLLPSETSNVHTSPWRYLAGRISPLERLLPVYSLRGRLFRGVSDRIP